jgi:hypothetical protein
MKKTTWIEVVFFVSVLIFLAALVFAFGVRTELMGDDQGKNNLAEQYVIALRLYAADHNGEYPYPGFVSKPICLGSGNPGNKCQGDATESVPVEADLATYLGGTESDPEPLYIHGQNYGGLGYVCFAVDSSLPQNPQCQSYGLFWNTHYRSACIEGASTGPANQCIFTR